MKEYFTATLYEEKDLLIGTNSKSIILGQKGNWVIIDPDQLKKIEKHYSSGILPLELEDICCKQVKNSILISQLNNLVSVRKNLLNSNLLGDYNV